jgi:hypothetical protein
MGVECYPKYLHLRTNHAISDNAPITIHQPLTAIRRQCGGFHIQACFPWPTPRATKSPAIAEATNSPTSE